MPEKALEGEIVPETAAQDLSAVKQNFMSAAVQFAIDMLSLVRRADELASYYFANSLNSGAANQIVLADVPASLGWLTPAIVGNIVTQAQLESNCATGASSFVAGTISAGVRDQLRQATGRPNTAG
jgi:hypothetical protein